MADVLLVNKVDSASVEQLRVLMADLAAANPSAIVVRAASPVSLADGPPLAGKAVLVVEDGPTITHGGMPWGAGTVAAQQGGARRTAAARGGIVRTATLSSDVRSPEREGNAQARVRQDPGLLSGCWGGYGRGR
jgi:predicted GTPase